MAGNFWLSSHFQQWLFDRQDLIRERQEDYQVLTEEEYQKVMIFFANVMQAIGEPLKMKQQVIATATIYFKRFYIRNSLSSVDPLLMAPTCLFLASKVDEFGVQSNNRFIEVCRNVVKTKFGYAFQQEFQYRMPNIFECEFYLLEMMDCCLIVFHPYRPLVQFCQELGTSLDKKDQHQQDLILQTAWKTINDTLRTDICLLYPPYLVALACMQVACIILGKDFKQWFAELSVDIDKCVEVVKLILNLYDMWKTFDEKKEIPALLAKIPKPKSSPR
ncbi:Cyclin-C [Hypsibius exemplaris]|uniref:Cyclin-C n=1 Tax=Hypsibius exemplaris TaxID=2072580 RepID=A0A1W0WEP2_HYPEX|nr:Cyclin-C [Hypsibius exemplaris]